MDVNIRVPAIEKLIDYTASGVGSVAGSMLAPWQAGRNADALRIRTQGEADAMQIIAKAQSDARATLVSPTAVVHGEIDFPQMVNQRLQFQEEKRQRNIMSVVQQAADELGDANKEVPNDEPNHDWTARFFNEVQDVSSEDMQALWGRVLAGEVERPGNTSIRTLSVLRNLDQTSAALFRKLCSACIFESVGDFQVIDARISSLGGNAGENILGKYGLSFSSLNVLNEYGLIISEYNSWRDYQTCIGINLPSGTSPTTLRIPFKHQNRFWILEPTATRNRSQEFKLTGVVLSRAGRELSKVVDLEPMEEYTQDLMQFLNSQNLQMIEVASGEPQVMSLA